MTTVDQGNPSRAQIRGAHGPTQVLRVAWHMISLDNTSAALLPGVLFTLSAWKTSRLPADCLPMISVRSFAFFLLYAYCFLLSNQLAGVDEDRINKPHRPLVAGELSVRHARWALAVLTIAYLVAGWWLGVEVWVAVWIATAVAHNQFRLSRYWLAKDGANFIGAVCMMASAWAQVEPLTSAAWRWIAVVSVVVGILIPLQDLRDLAGDLEVGRRTFPVVIGEHATRVFLAVGFAALPFVIYFFLLASAQMTPVLAAGAVAMAALNIATAYRLLARRSPRADHVTYLLFCWWYCVALASAGFAA